MSFWRKSSYSGCAGVSRTDFLKGCGYPKRTNFWQFPLQRDVVVLKAQIVYSSLWEGVEYLKGLILYKFHFGRVWWSCQDWFWQGTVVFKWLILDSYWFRMVLWTWKDWFVISCTLGGWDGLERSDFGLFWIWEDVVVLIGLIFKFQLWEDVVFLK